MLIHKYLVSTIFLIWGVLWVELYGLYFIISSYFAYSFISVLDVMFGFYLARRGKIVSSKTFWDWLFNKVMWLFLLAGMIFFLGNMSYVISNEKITELASILVILTMWWALIKETISLLENFAVLSNERESKVLHWIVDMLLKIVGIWQNQLQKKVEKYLPPK